MSAIENQGPWSNISNEVLDPKYEKCRNITEEIYKRINITFQIKQLETGVQSDPSDLSDQIDSNELSNETDLFACDKSSLSSSTDVEQLERSAAACEKYININNNEEQLKKTPLVAKKPRKRFRKRIKKTQKQQQKRDSDGSSDEGPPLSLVAELGRPARVPRLVLLAADISKFKSPTSEKSQKLSKKPEADSKSKAVDKKPKTIHVGDDMLPIIPIVPIEFAQKLDVKLRSDRGLRRHTSMGHQTDAERDKRRTEQRGKPA